MTAVLIDETFVTPPFDSRLCWLNPPGSWRHSPAGLVLEPDAATDYWQKTHYGFAADNGHCLLAEVTGDFVLTTAVQFNPAHQYDQAGLMVRISADCWLKSSVEYEPDGPAKLGAVVTNYGYSDWSTQNFTGPNQVTLRVRREGSDYTVEYLAREQVWTQLRLAHLHADDGRMPVQAGLYACSPKAAGYVATFNYLKIEA